ncbi:MULTISPECIES: ABC transporter substrate-binding protein [Agrobacterium]|nr:MULTISPECIES: ABC transporter substrate-binding protein [Agrobacterium]NTA13927.1 ABC transporter substrate-binding protein [Agrobacterium tumefaciens]WCK05838.1 ABC transporter substrate-binding protein [Agrobacterium tumefaciens]CUX71797.1 ABC-type nitrate/sulfonate/bicarbonate transport system, periplasmic component [Agrobacterium sp. NCPPB 925]
MDEQHSSSQRWTMAVRFLTLSLFFTLAFAAFAGPGQAQEKTKFRFGVLYSNPLAALIAVERGYFKEEGIDVELVPVQNGPAAIAAATSGAVDVTFGDILAWSSGLSNGFTNVKLLLPGTYNGSSDLLVGPKSSLRVASDFVGKRIGVPPAPTFGLSVRIWLEAAGVDPSSVKQVIIPTNGDGQALARGDVDAVLTFEPASSRLVLEQGAVSLGDTTEKAAPEGATFTAYYANENFAKTNPELLARIARAINRVVADEKNITIKERALILGKYSGIDLVELDKAVPGLIDRIRFGKFQTKPVNIAATQAWLDRAAKFGGVPASVDITPHILSPALGK